MRILGCDDCVIGGLVGVRSGLLFEFGVCFAVGVISSLPL